MVGIAEIIYNNNPPPMNGDGACNILDVQIVIDAALGGQCQAGASPQSLPVTSLVRKR